MLAARAPFRGLVWAARRFASGGGGAVASAAQEDHALFDVDSHGVGRITLNNPKRRNPLSKSVLQRLGAILDDVVASQQAAGASRVRALILQSTGPVFSSGHDFSEFVASAGAAEHEEILGMCTAINVRLQRECPPTIAAVDGLATAAGCQLVCSCDLVFATRASKFCVPGSRNGGFCHTPGVALASKVHPRKALEMLLLADDVPAEEAARLGLVNRLAADADELLLEVDAAALKIAATSARNTLRGKQGFYAHVDIPRLEDKYADASVRMLDMFMSGDQQEGIDAFFAKREPVWRDA